MSVWENQVNYNLSESGVHPLTIEELVEDPKQIEELLSTSLKYAQSNGILELREKHRRSLPKRDARQYHRNNWCCPGKLHVYLDTYGAERRDRGDASKLHADLGDRSETSV